MIIIIIIICCWQDTQGWPIYFGRKFEAIVNQEVINKVDTLFLGLPPPATGRITNYTRYHKHTI